MSKFLIVEQSQRDKSVFYNFAVLEAEGEEEAESKYLEEIDVDLEESDLIITNLDDVDGDFYYFYEVDIEKSL